MVYGIFIYNRKGVCLYSREWQLAEDGEADGEKHRLIFGEAQGPQNIPGDAARCARADFRSLSLEIKSWNRTPASRADVRGRAAAKRDGHCASASNS